MYAFDKKVPVKNIAPKSSKHNDRPVKETNGSRYYLDDAKLNAKSASSNVAQRVLFADIPLDARGKFDYKGIGEMQVWWFMACEWKKQSDLGHFTPEGHLKSLRSLLLRALEPFDVESRDRVRLASHGYHGRICINGGCCDAGSRAGLGIIDQIKEKIKPGHDKQVDADYCFIAQSGLPITWESGEKNIEDFDGVTISAVGQTWIFKDAEKDMAEISKRMERFDTGEMTGVQALEHKYPDKLPLPGQCTKMEFEYIRHGTTSLMRFFDVATDCMEKPYLNSTRTEEDFVEAVKALAGTDPQAPWTFICDGLNTHKPEALVRFVYTPKHSSWMNQIEIWFGIINRKLLKRKSCLSIEELESSILRFIEQYNLTAHPLKWTYAGIPLAT